MKRKLAQFAVGVCLLIVAVMPMGCGKPAPDGESAYIASGVLVMQHFGTTDNNAVQQPDFEKVKALTQQAGENQWTVKGHADIQKPGLPLISVDYDATMVYDPAKGDWRRSTIAIYDQNRQPLNDEAKRVTQAAMPTAPALHTVTYRVTGAVFGSLDIYYIDAQGKSQTTRLLPDKGTSIDLSAQGTPINLPWEQTITTPTLTNLYVGATSWNVNSAQVEILVDGKPVCNKPLILKAQQELPSNFQKLPSSFHGSCGINTG